MKLYLGFWVGTKDDRTGYWLRWWDESKRMLPWALERVEQRFQQGKLSIINRFLTRKVGEVPAEVRSRIEALSADGLDELSEALLDLTHLEDLINWLDSQIN